MLLSEQRASISTPITITSSGVLNEVTHSSAAGANHCSLLPKHSDNGWQKGGLGWREMLNLAPAHTVHKGRHMVAGGEWRGKEVSDIVRKKRDAHLSCASFPLAKTACETGQQRGDLSTAAPALLYDPLHHHIRAVNPSSKRHAAADMWFLSRHFTAGPDSVVIQ